MYVKSRYTIENQCMQLIIYYKYCQEITKAMSVKTRYRIVEKLMHAT